MENARPAEPGRRWSVDAFIGFWKKPDVSRVVGSVTEDIVGYCRAPSVSFEAHFPMSKS
jgi:hypothetical protein